MMIIKRITVLLLLALTLSGCYGSITGTVVDSDTGEPIEGAVVLVEWTRTKGIGLEHTESYKVVEAVTDKDGKFAVSGTYNPLVNPPDLTIYKRGYVAWNNHWMFPDRKKREDFKWHTGYVFKLEHFKSTYSYDAHYYFINSAVHPQTANEEKNLLWKAYNSWERNMAIEESNRKSRRY